MAHDDGWILCKTCRVKVSPLVTPRPDTPHAAELRCPLCEGFHSWLPKPKNEGKRPKNKHTPGSLGIEYCQMCMRPKSRLGTHEVLVSHHVEEIQNGGPDEPENIWVVCQVCHALIHHQRTYLNQHQVHVWEIYEALKQAFSERANGNGDQYQQMMRTIVEKLGI